MWEIVAAYIFDSTSATMSCDLKSYVILFVDDSFLMHSEFWCTMSKFAHEQVYFELFESAANLPGLL
jgi:hypothetical protein